MNSWISRLSIICVLAFGAGCGDDDPTTGPDGEGGEGGTPSEGTSGAGGAGGAGSEPVTCEAPTPPENASELAIIGEYDDSWDGEQIVSATQWKSGSLVFNISAFDNDAGWVIAQNDQANEYSPCLWSRFDWTEQDERLYYCQTAFDAETEEAAREATAPDASDPEASGCGAGFSWTELFPR